MASPKLSEFKNFYKTRIEMRRNMDEATRTAQVKGYGTRKVADMHAQAANRSAVKLYNAQPKGLTGDQKFKLLQRADQYFERSKSKSLGPSAKSVKQEMRSQVREDRKSDSIVERKQRIASMKNQMRIDAKDHSKKMAGLKAVRKDIRSIGKQANKLGGKGGGGAPAAVTQGKLFQASKSSSPTIQDIQRQHRTELVTRLPMWATKKQYDNVDKILAKRFPELNPDGSWRKGEGPAKRGAIAPKALTQGKMLGPSKASVKKERAAQDREDRKAEKAYEKKTRGSQGGGKDQPRDEIGRWS